MAYTDAMITGITAGKFYPLHTGHQYMLTEASSQVDKLYILVVQDKNEWPAGVLRKQWVKELFPQAKVILCSNLPGQENDSVAWAQYARDLIYAADNKTVASIDKVFGSEDYTRSWAAELGAEAIVVDQSRVAVPISGTRLREDPHRLWKYLTKPAREFYCKRFCIVGGESTGKSTMTRSIADKLDILYTPEVGRWYVEAYGDSVDDPAIWNTIYSTQLEIENHLARQSNGMLVCDTDLMTSAVWHERWTGNSEEGHYFIMKWMMARWERFNELPYYRYVLLDHTVPWIDDGTRTESENRQWFTDRLRHHLDIRDIDYLHIKSEDYGERERLAMEYFLS
jgi:HTH-type transcriptional repressor of NAD biosynthesis genes